MKKRKGIISNTIGNFLVIEKFRRGVIVKFISEGICKSTSESVKCEILLVAESNCNFGKDLYSIEWFDGLHARALTSTEATY